MMVTPSLARRIEDAEAAALRPIALVRGFAQPFAGGAASFVRAGSPFNKVIGAGLDRLLDLHAVDEIARRYESEPVRFELATLGPPANAALLSDLGYRLLGFEDVLARALVRGAQVPSRIEVRRIDDPRLWRDTYVAAAAVGDDTGANVDALSAQAIADALDDDLAAAAGERYIARLDGAVAGVASMFIHDDVALLNGAATLPAFRKRGVQTALVSARLADAAARGCAFATLATAPGSRSEANAFRHGFTIGYARAILVSASVGRRARS